MDKNGLSFSALSFIGLISIIDAARQPPKLMGESSFMTRYNYLFVLSKGNEIVVYDAGTDDQEIKLVKHASGTEVIGMLKSCQRT